jgi:superfamily I DNA/RNA helicase
MIEHELDFAAQQIGDDAARQRITASIGDTLFVEAGAGTGKTRALVDRVISLVLGGVQIDRIAAITFTERAAAELRDRVRSGLETHARTYGPSEAIEDALASLDRAQISTIHSFCQSLLKSFAAQAGVDPDFKVLDEVTDFRRTQEKWREEIESLASDPDAPGTIDRVLSLGLTTRDIEGLAMAVLKSADLAEEMEANPVVLPEPMWPDLSTVARRLRETGYEHVDSEDKLHRAIEALSQFVDRLSAAGNRRESLLPAAPPLRGNPGQKPNWGRNGAMPKEDALESAKEVADDFHALKEHLRSKALANILPFIVRFARKDETRRGREGF